MVSSGGGKELYADIVLLNEENRKESGSEYGNPVFKEKESGYDAVENHYA